MADDAPRDARAAIEWHVASDVLLGISFRVGNDVGEERDPIRPRDRRGISLRECGEACRGRTDLCLVSEEGNDQSDAHRGTSQAGVFHEEVATLDGDEDL